VSFWLDFKWVCDVCVGFGDAFVYGFWVSPDFLMVMAAFEMAVFLVHYP
jgi:hypothetical protein